MSTADIISLAIQFVLVLYCMCYIMANNLVGPICPLTVTTLVFLWCKYHHKIVSWCKYHRKIISWCKYSAKYVDLLTALASLENDCKYCSAPVGHTEGSTWNGSKFYWIKKEDKNSSHWSHDIVYCIEFTTFHLFSDCCHNQNLRAV